jgi:hypothetical protein
MQYSLRVLPKKFYHKEKTTFSSPEIVKQFISIIIFNKEHVILYSLIKNNIGWELSSW